jgi:hypothetical protein
LYEEQVNAHHFDVMLDWGETYLGAVTGNNKYFTLTHADANRLKIPMEELIPISPPGSAHLKGLALSERAWQRLADDGSPCYLFAPSHRPSRASLRYIAEGEKGGVNKAYKCKVRDPWWMVPRVQRPDLLFTYMNHDRIRIVRNAAGVHVLNSIYGIKLAPERRAVGQELLPLCALNSLTLLGAEIVGRSYGGGMLKHEPTEVDALPVPSFDTVSCVASRLRLLQSQVAGLMRRNDVSPAIDIVDRAILHEHLGLSDSAIESIRMARATLVQRRLGRGRGQRGEN